MLANIHKIITKSSVNGPGKRAVIWFQGCPMSCKNCINQDARAIKINQIISTYELMNHILKIDGIEGVTFSGGEPFFQADAAGQLANLLQKENLSVMCYTGYSYEFLLQRNNKSYNYLLQNTDILISEPYNYKLEQNHAWAGSANQKIFFLSSKYGHLQDRNNIQKRMEIHIAKNGELEITGFMPK